MASVAPPPKRSARLALLPPVVYIGDEDDATGKRCAAAPLPHTLARFALRFHASHSVVSGSPLTHGSESMPLHDGLRCMFAALISAAYDMEW